MTAKAAMPSEVSATASHPTLERVVILRVGVVVGCRLVDVDRDCFRLAAEFDRLLGGANEFRLSFLRLASIES